MVFARLVVPALFWLGLAAMASSQTATLLADSVDVQPNGVISASGNVEILLDGSRLTATRITFDAATDSLNIEGPIVLITGDNTLLLADAAELDSDLRNGILHSARLVLNQQLQLAASQIAHVDGRFYQLDNTIASSCRICGSNPEPLWQIRASKIVHDTQEQQLYFTDAQLRVGGVPIFYLPRLRLPDPTLDRATGFLVPSFRTSSRLGGGVKIPYFVKLGDHADLTITPFLNGAGTTIETRYRHAFFRGNLQFDAAVTRDQLLPGKTRAYVFGKGTFTLPRDFTLKFDVELTSDPAYLLEYSFSDKDRLDSAVSVQRTRDTEYFNAGITSFETLRGSELAIDDQLPNFQGEIFYERRFFPENLGGQGRWSLGFETHGRESTADQVGRDVSHAKGRLSWTRNHFFDNGMIGRVGTYLWADAYHITQDSTVASNLALVTPAADVELRWPFVRTARDGAMLVLEPVVQLSWTTNIGSSVPNEDSSLVEFDEGNLFSISRFPGDDRIETGARTTAGLKWTRYDPKGQELSFVLGRVLRNEDTQQFTAASGLDGKYSDWLVAGQVKLPSGLDVTGRAVFDDKFDVSKAETRANWRGKKLAVAATYTWVVPDASEGRPDLTSQLTLDATYRIKRHWNSSLSYLYDFEASRSTEALVGLEYINECIRVDFSLSRRFTSSTSVAPNTDFGVSVNLLGFGSGSDGVPRACSG